MLPWPTCFYGRLGRQFPSEFLLELGHKTKGYTGMELAGNLCDLLDLEAWREGSLQLVAWCRAGCETRGLVT